MTRDKLENIVRDELYSHCDPLELTIDDKRLVSAILDALEAERVWEVVIPEDQLIAMCTGGTVEREFWNKIKGKKGSLIFREDK